MPVKKISTGHKGRKCKYPQCGRLLSIYNLEANCNVHLKQVIRETRWEVDDETALKKKNGL